MRLYPDVCCLNRPFNDRTQERIRLEAEAVLTVLTRIQQGTATGIYSPMHAEEIGNIRDPERHLLVELLADALIETVSETEDIADRTSELEAMGFHREDARHLAFAETAQCDVFLTTDDQLERCANRNLGQIHVRVVNPTVFVMEEHSE